MLAEGLPRQEGPSQCASWKYSTQFMSFAGLGYKAADVGKNGCEHPGNNADSQLMSHGRTSRFRSATSTTEDPFPMLLR